MASKTLADKLIDLGYDIKGHSSSVSEEVANDIRKTVLGFSKTEVVEKRISVKSGATVIRRRAETVLQMPPEVAVPESEPTPPPAAESSLAPAAEKKTATVLRRKKDAEPAEELPAAPAPEESVPPAVVEELPAVVVEPVEEPVAIEPAPEELIASLAPELPAAVSEEKGAEVAPEPVAIETPEEAAARIKAEPPAKSRKGFAKIIKRAAIQLPPEEEPKIAKPLKTVKNFKVKGLGVEQIIASDIPVDIDEDIKDRRKGKRLVQIKPEAVVKGRAKGAGAIPKRRGRGGDEPDGGEEVDRLLRGRKPAKKKFQEVQQPAAESKAIKRRIKVFETITVGDLAHRMGVKVNQLIAKLMGLGVMATVNQALDVDSAMLVSADFGYEIEQAMSNETHILNLEEQEGGGEPQPRPPVVTVMGHVDHGKTSILDAIRKTDVAVGEAGGITQHIGAYYVRSSAGDVVFLDTPGHAAFTEMRSRGAQVTDVVVLVVAADDGVMDQTKEAINHAQAAGVPIVVAVNKIDKPNADPSRVKRELADLGLAPEEWGGQVIYCETSAKKNLGIESLLENILLQAEILELKADPQRRARGRVIEAQLHKGRGPVATVLIQEGTLRAGDPFVVGQYHGKVRALINDKGEAMAEAGPSMPVEVQGLSGVPLAGDDFLVVTDEKMAKNVSASRQLKARETELAATNKISLDKLFEKMQKGDVKELRVILRADVQGTLEAFGKAIEQLSTDAIKVKVLHEGTGTISESDVLLASASEAIIIGFNVRPTAKIKDLTEREKVDIRFYDVIYHALDDIRKAMVGMLAPTYKERVIGAAEVRQTFSVPKIGTIAGCYVIDGKIERNAQVRVLRDGVVAYTGKLSSLRRFKDDAREVQSGYECGIGVENFNDIKVGDVLEVYVMDEVASTL